MTGPIVCGVDESESARGAAWVARELSAKLRLRLVFVRVVEDAVADDEIAAIAARLYDLVDSTTELDCGVAWLVDVGHAADRLVAVAEEEKAALIVVGSTGPRSSLLGSVSADVSRRAPCPVVVVAPGADGSFANGRDPREVRGGSRLVDHSYTGVAGSIRLGRSARRGRVKDDPETRDFAGGIVRFNVGNGESSRAMPTDPIVRWENEGGAVLPGLPVRGRRDAESDRERESRASTKAPTESVAAPSPLSSQHDRQPRRGGGA